MTSFVRHLRSQVERFADSRSFIHVDSRNGQLVERQRMSFTELDARAQSIGAALIHQGMHGRPALLLYPAGLEFVTALWGCLYAGCIAAPGPLPATDPRALERAAALLTDQGVDWILTDAVSHPRLQAWLDDLGLADRVHCVATDTAITESATMAPRPDQAPDTVAYLQYTSGSTSEPRGVVVTHGNLLHNCAQVAAVGGSSDHEPAVTWLPHYHDMCLVGTLLTPLWLGIDCILTSPLTFAVHPAIWVQMINEYRAGVTGAPNFAYDYLARTITDDQLTGLDLSCWKFALNGAEPIRTSTLARFTAKLAPAGFDPRALAPAYGLAESTLIVSGTRRGTGATSSRFDRAALEHHRAVPADPAGDDGVELVACGHPMDTSLRIVDPDTLAVLPENRIGEIWIAGPSVAHGYWQHPDDTRSTFDAYTTDQQGPFLRTGDLGFLQDGQLYVTGRLKELIIVQGRNLYPHDIEETGRHAHPAAGTSAAFALQLTDTEHLVLIQEVRPRRLDGLTHRQLARLIKQAIGHSYNVAASVLVVPRNRIAKTTSGKIQRGRMRQAFLNGDLDPLHSDLTPELTAARLYPATVPIPD